MEGKMVGKERGREKQVFRLEEKRGGTWAGREGEKEVFRQERREGKYLGSEVEKRALWREGGIWEIGERSMDERRVRVNGERG